MLQHKVCISGFFGACRIPTSMSTKLPSRCEHDAGSEKQLGRVRIPSSASSPGGPKGATVTGRLPSERYPGLFKPEAQAKE